MLLLEEERAVKISCAVMFVRTDWFWEAQTLSGPSLPAAALSPDDREVGLNADIRASRKR
jgi:hypothetical protein